MDLCWSGKECMINVLESEYLENKDREYMPEHTWGGGRGGGGGGGGGGRDRYEC